MFRLFDPKIPDTGEFREIPGREQADDGYSGHEQQYRNHEKRVFRKFPAISRDRQVFETVQTSKEEETESANSAHNNHGAKGVTVFPVIGKQADYQGGKFLVRNSIAPFSGFFSDRPDTFSDPYARTEPADACKDRNNPRYNDYWGELCSSPGRNVQENRNDLPENDYHPHRYREGGKEMVEE